MLAIAFIFNRAMIPVRNMHGRRLSSGGNRPFGPSKLMPNHD